MYTTEMEAGTYIILQNKHSHIQNEMYVITVLLTEQCL